MIISKNPFRATLSLIIFISMSHISNAQEAKVDKYANRRLFVLHFTPGKNWKKDVPMSQQDLEEHRAYYQQLLEKDKVVIGGGFTEADEGMSILKVNSRAEADSLVRNDPAVLSGIFNIEVKPFFAVFRDRNEETLDLKGLVFKKRSP